MKKGKLVIAALGILSMASAIFFVLSGDKALLAHPKGIIAKSELNLIILNISLMLIVVVPAFILLFAILWKYHAKKSKTVEDLEHSYGVFTQAVLWIIPSLIVAIMAVITWKATHELDPYRPLNSDIKPLTIQVVAMDWKWLFIYPEQGIATVNFVQFPALTPIRLALSADGSPMNSFWLPELSGQIYTMTGMVTTLHIMADLPGVYTGAAAEINGAGFADMTFIAKSASQSDFDDWVAQVKRSAPKLTDPVYNELLKPSKKNPVALYSHVEKDLFDKIVMKYMQTPTSSL